MLNGAELIGCFGKNYTIKRSSKEGCYVDGRWQASRRDTEFTVLASIQPVDGRTLERLPEAQRTLETRKMYAACVLQNTVEDIGRNADRVIIDGEEWEVATVELWGPMLDHSKCIIIRMNTDSGVVR